MVTVSIYGKVVEVSETNPAFNFHTGRSLPYIITFAIVGDGERIWREDFKVSNPEVAEEQIREVIQFFNDTTREGERGRIFHEMYVENKELQAYEDEQGMSGWLSPTGKFYPCGFGEHSIFAMKVLENKYEYDVSSDIARQNSFIPMSVDERSEFSHLSINEGITPEQMEWFNKFFYKLSRMQKGILSRACDQQGLKMKYDW